MNRILIFIFLFFATNAYPCDCAEKPSIEVNWENANEVFKGKIIKVDSLLYGNNGVKIHTYTVEILKSFKQDFFKGREFRTILSRDGGSSDFMFEVGKV